MTGQRLSGKVPSMSTPCQETDPEIWFDTRQIDLAVALCTDCPIKAACYAKAVENDEGYGVWGGTDFNRSFVPAFKMPAETVGNPVKKISIWPSNRKNKVGGMCRSGKHILTPSNTRIRPNDNALMCLECLAITKANFKKTENEWTPW